MFFMEYSPSRQVPLTSQSIPQKSSRTVLIVTFLENIAVGALHVFINLFYKRQYSRGAYRLVFYTNQLGRNLMHKHKTIKYEEVGEQSALQTKVRRKIASPQVTTHIF